MATTMALAEGPRKRVRRSRAVAQLTEGPGAERAELPLTVPVAQPAMLASSSGGAAPDVGWRYIIRNLQPVVIALAFCLTAIVCVWIASNRTTISNAPRFQTIDFDDEDGKTLLKFDRESGRAWRLAKMRVPVRARKADGSTGPQLVAGWEEISPSFEQGVQDTWHRMGAPTPPP
jgi:hypothetical protein